MVVSNRTHYQNNVALLVSLAELECLCQSVSIKRPPTSKMKCVLYMAKVFSALDSIVVEKAHA